MPVKILSIALWIPFGIVFLISAILFCRTGYKRGLWRSLISLGATAVSASVSLLLAGLMAQPIAGALIAALKQRRALGELEAFRPLLAGVVKSLLALIIFSVLLFITAIIAKVLADKYLKKYCMTDRKELRWGGLGVRLIDALLYTQLLLLPLYGTIAAYFPAVNTVMTATAQIREDETAHQMLELVDTAANHPVTRLSAVSPASLVYRSLSTIRTEHGNLDITAAARSVSGTIERIQVLEASFQSGTPDPAMIREFLNYLRNDVVDQEWFYTACMELVGVIAEKGAADGSEEMVRFSELAAMSREDFVVNAEALLEFGEFAMQERIVSCLTESPEDPYEFMKETGLIAKVGETINATAQAVSVRQLLVQMYLQKADLAGTELYGMILNAWGGEPTNDPEAQFGQAMALIGILESGSQKLDMLKSNLYLENLDREAVRRYIMTAPLSELFPDQYICISSLNGGLITGDTIYDVSFSFEDMEISDGYYIISGFGTAGSGDGSDGIEFDYSSDPDGRETIITPGFGNNWGSGTQTGDAVYFEGWDLLTEYLGGEDALRQKLWDAMVNAADTDSHVNIAHIFNAWISLSNLGNTELPDSYCCYIPADAMKWAAGELGSEYFDWLHDSGKLTASSAVYTLLEQACELMETGEIEFISGLDCSMWDLAAAVEMCTADADDDKLYDVLCCYGRGNSGCKVVQTVVETHGSDPLGIGSLISAEEEATIIRCAGELEYMYVTGNDEMTSADRAAALLAFFGLE